MIMGELVIGLILHILMSTLLIIHHLLLLPGIGLLTSQPGCLLSLLNLLPLLLALLQGLLCLLLVLPLLYLILRHLSSHFSRESSPEIHPLLTGEKISTR